MMRPDLEDAVPLRVGYADDGAQLQSFALRDVGVDPLFDLPAMETLYRAKLGDMCFVVRRRADGSISRLYFVPEFPNNNLGLVRRIVSYYALSVLGPKVDLCELRASDPTLKIIDWQAGVSMLVAMREKADGTAKKTIDRILEIDEMRKHCRPNVTVTEMRESIGPATGARLTVSSYLVGDVA